jgi:acyl-CoA synthetase (AMP-forming)/AMP-acid ligase II
LQFTQGLHRAVQQQPQAIATVCNGRRRTFAELADRVARLANGLRDLHGRGLRPGDRAAILAFNSDRYLEFYLACPWIGAQVAPMNFRWSLEEVIFALKDCEAITIFLDDHFAKYADALFEACPYLRFAVYCGDGECPDGLVSHESLISANAPATDLGVAGGETYGVFYTGGTTGRSKGVLLSHANIISSGFAVLAEGPFGAGAVALHAAPMFHLADMMTTVCSLLRGARHVMLPAFRPEVALELIAGERITELLLVPTMLQAVVDHPKLASYDLSSVRCLMYGASPAPEALLARAAKALPTAGFHQVFGMTELSATATMLRPGDHLDPPPGRLRSAGRALCHVEIRIIDADDGEVARGEIGEIAVRGPNVMQGYLNLPEATAETLRGGWMHTGDMGRMDADGYVFIVDRLKDMIISGGENIYCAEVENAIAMHPAVAAAAVIGIPSEEWGETVHAVVVPKAGATLTQDELYRHCRELIAGYKCPRSIELRESLPVSGAGKVLKTALREPWWQGRQRAVN